MNKNIVKFAALPFVLFASQANAAMMSYDLTLANAIADGPAYLTVTISDGTDAGVLGDVDFSVVVNTAVFPGVPVSGGNFGMDNFYFNYDNSLDVTSKDIKDIDPSSWAVKADKNAGGDFGFFDFNLKGNGSSRTELLSFSITGVIGDTLSSYAIGYDGGDSAYFAAHVGGFDAGGGVTSSKFASTEITVIPVPAAVWLFGSGLIGLAGIARRRK